MILKMNLKPEQFASLAAFVASEKNQVKAPQGHNWRILNDGITGDSRYLQFVSIRQSKQNWADFSVTLEVITENNAIQRHEREAQSLPISRSYLVDLLDAIGIFPEVSNGS